MSSSIFAQGKARAADLTLTLAARISSPPELAAERTRSGGVCREDAGRRGLGAMLTKMGFWSFGRARDEVGFASRVVTAFAQDRVKVRAKLTISFEAALPAAAAEAAAEACAESLRALVRNSPTHASLLGAESSVAARLRAELPREALEGRVVRQVEVAALHVVAPFEDSTFPPGGASPSTLAPVNPQPLPRPSPPPDPTTAPAPGLTARLLAREREAAKTTLPPKPAPRLAPETEEPSRSAVDLRGPGEVPRPPRLPLDLENMALPRAEAREAAPPKRAAGEAPEPGKSAAPKDGPSAGPSAEASPSTSSIPPVGEARCAPHPALLRANLPLGASPEAMGRALAPACEAWARRLLRALLRGEPSGIAAQAPSPALRREAAVAAASLLQRAMLSAGIPVNIALDALSAVSAAAFGQGPDFVIETGRYVGAPTLAELASELRGRAHELGAPGAAENALRPALARAAEDALLAAQRVHAASGL